MSRIHLRQGELELELEGDEGFIATHLPTLLAAMGLQGAAEPRPVPPAARAPRVPEGFRVQKNLSLDDFVALKAPTEELDRLLVLAYFQEKYEGVGSYGPDELGESWAKAWPDLAWSGELPRLAEERGYLVREYDGRLTLSYRGEQYVQDGLA